MEVNLEVYSGPLDMLLKLIRRKEINIYDIAIAQVAEEYLEEIKGITPDMGEISEFLVLAATLLEIKSNMLLPRYEEEAEEDPREALVQQLLAYEEAQGFAKILAGLTPSGHVYSCVGEPELLGTFSLKADVQPVMDLISLEQLSDVFSKVMNLKISKIDTVRAGYGQMPRERFTVTSKILFILDVLKEKGRVSLFSLFEVCGAKSELVVTFLAILELVRRGLARTVQTRAFCDVEVLPCLA